MQPSQSPRQPKRDYLATMHRVIRGMGVVGRELTRPGISPRQKMEKLGFNKVYKHWGRNRWNRPGEEVAKLIGISKGVSYWKKKTLEQAAKNLDQKGEPLKRQNVVEEEVYEAAEELKRDPRVPKMWVDKVVKNLLAEGRFARGKRVPGQKVGEIARGTPGIPKEIGEYIATVLEGKEQHQENPEFKQTTQGEWAQELKERKERGALNESDVIAAERSVGVETFGQSERGGKPQAPRSRWKISALTGWGRKSSGGNKS